MSITAAAPPVARVSAFRRLTMTELTLFVRDRTGPIFGIGFPLMLLVIFGNIPYFNDPKNGFNGFTLLDAYVPILIAFVVAILALNTLPPVLAGYRERGILRRLRTTPVGPVRVLAAQLVITFSVMAVAVILLLTVARLAFGVALPKQLAGFVIAVVLAAAALVAIGLFIAAVAPSGRAANAIGATVFYPMMFFAGLWLPIAAMPAVLRHISHATPLGAAAQALTDAAQGHWPHPLQLIAMAAYAVVFGLGAAKLFRWE
jgi:ABC-2 type transport system permease protein